MRLSLGREYVPVDKAVENNQAHLTDWWTGRSRFEVEGTGGGGDCALGISSGGEAIWRTMEMTGAMAMRIFSRGVIVGLFIGLYIGWAF